LTEKLLMHTIRKRQRRVRCSKR